MSEWWTYSFSDFLLFSPRTYYRLFELYNVAVWPAHILAIGLALTILALWLRGGRWQARVVAAIIAGCWLWVAWAYHLSRYETINWAAQYFAWAFATEALLLIWSGVIRDRFVLQPLPHPAGRLGLGFFLFGVAIYPLIGPLIGRSWLQTEIFGIAPDPTVLATLGVLLGTEGRVWHLLPIPLAWCTVSGATLWTMQSPDALVMPAAAMLVLALAGWRNRSQRHQI